MMVQDDPKRTELPVIVETASLEKRLVLTGRVRVHVTTETEEVPVSAALESESVEVTRVPVGQEITERPAIRTEGDLTIIPVVEEVLVVEKRLVLREEIHLRQTHRSETFSTTVPAKRQVARIERDAIAAKPDDLNPKG